MKNIIKKLKIHKYDILLIKFIQNTLVSKTPIV